MSEYTLHDLLDGGDWACSRAYHETLARVCQQLASIKPTVAPVALRIGEMALVDLSAASREWGQLSDALRQEVPLAGQLRRRGRIGAKRRGQVPAIDALERTSDGASYVLRHVTST